MVGLAGFARSNGTATVPHCAFAAAAGPHFPKVGMGAAAATHGTPSAATVARNAKTARRPIMAPNVYLVGSRRRDPLSKAAFAFARDCGRLAGARDTPTPDAEQAPRSRPRFLHRSGSLARAVRRPAQMPRARTGSDPGTIRVAEQGWLRTTVAGQQSRTDAELHAVADEGVARPLSAVASRREVHPRPGAAVPMDRTSSRAAPYLCRDLASSAGSGLSGLDCWVAGGACARLVVAGVCARGRPALFRSTTRVGSGSAT